ncbi:hypothetical protein AVEN_13970-1 [Araneus ventricosus]|uniref:Uncharacterized protein n=1 Tax=Araneus ventricosus TaxID=182803 RepID=A0A4Y2K4P0_ARAVE|nr:hypothetical protein AVEN_13970-1 [Araneus ventricosus]
MVTSFPDVNDDSQNGLGDPPDGSIDVRESVYMYIYKEKIVREHLTGPQHYPDNGLVSGTRGEVSRNQEAKTDSCAIKSTSTEFPLQNS